VAACNSGGESIESRGSQNPLVVYMHRSPSAGGSRLTFSPGALAFLFIAFLTGCASALQVPTLSLFLSQSLGARPFLIGLFYTVNACAGIVISQMLAHWSDHGGDRRRLILLCCWAGLACCLLFAFDRHYWLLITLGVVLSSFGATANPQVFALAREHGARGAHHAAWFNSLMRAQISLAWVLGPPLAFALAVGYGFKTLYLVAGLSFVACALLVARALPEIAPVERSGSKSAGWNDPALRLPFVTSTLMWTCNGMYLIAMPLYLMRVLGLPAHVPGSLMGLAAGLEIPVMLVAGYHAQRFGILPMMRFAAVCAVLFYLGMSLLSNETALLWLQIANAGFIGIIAAIGMLYFQDLMPQRLGTATTLFTTSTRSGTIIAGALVGAIGEAWGYHAVFYAMLACSVAACGCTFALRAR